MKIPKKPRVNFYPRDSGFFQDFFPSGYTGDFLFRDRDFFSWDGISRQKATSAYLS